ncbi:hypothetical protein GC093_00805 [Paenibacillus sp. LMG 31456]|uniref:Uncharacterized protein n=1 Tax=Paenibacillus foliorum TaxID=2654974 RepID=A0A972JWU5_9BACL|nr:hypothetical protein [Paenibacillus foliorum]NOU91779.1 hypothetical protein [Paenibacillus foliorum]
MGNSNIQNENTKEAGTKTTKGSSTKTTKGSSTKTTKGSRTSYAGLFPFVILYRMYKYVSSSGGIRSATFLSQRRLQVSEAYSIY